MCLNYRSDFLMQLLSHGQSLISINFFTKTLLKERGYVVIIIIIPPALVGAHLPSLAVVDGQAAGA